MGRKDLSFGPVLAVFGTLALVGALVFAAIDVRKAVVNDRGFSVIMRLIRDAEYSMKGVGGSGDDSAQP